MKPLLRSETSAEETDPLADSGPYYQDKIASLRTIFGTDDIELGAESIRVGTTRYLIRNDVILIDAPKPAPATPLGQEIQGTFAAEWNEFRDIMPEHSREFQQYFDLVDLGSLANLRVCDLGCGNGRWSFFLKDYCRELVLIDFSDAIFIARENLRDAKNCIFLKADLQHLPLVPDFADFLFCLGVLHHLPVPCLDAVKKLKSYAPRQLIFLYYAVENRPRYFRFLLRGVTAIRRVVPSLRSLPLRRVFSFWVTILIYYPMILLGRVMDLVGCGSRIPLYEFYANKSLRRIQQDAYDRFFTPIEQRVTQSEIRGLEQHFSKVNISPHLPYWHFLLIR